MHLGVQETYFVIDDIMGLEKTLKDVPYSLIACIQALLIFHPAPGDHSLKTS